MTNANWNVWLAAAREKGVEFTEDGLLSIALARQLYDAFIQSTEKYSLAELVKRIVPTGSGAGYVDPIKTICEAWCRAKLLRQLPTGGYQRAI